MIDRMRGSIWIRMRLKPHPKSFEIIENGGHTGAEVLLVLVREALLPGAFHRFDSMRHRFFMRTFELPMKSEVGEIHVWKPCLLQAGEAGNEVVPHGNRHVFK